MVTPTKDELAGEVEQRVRTMENSVSKAEGAVSILKWVLSIFVPIVTLAMAGLITLILDLKATVAMNVERTSELKNQHTAELARFEKSLDKLEGLINRQTVQAPHRLKEGVLNRFAQETMAVRVLVVKGEDGKEWTCTLTPETKITINGKDAKADDLKANMQIQAELDERDRAIRIEAVEPGVNPASPIRRIIRPRPPAQPSP